MLVFAAVVFDEKLTHLPSLSRTLVAFVLLCMMSSAVYLMNDLVDVDSDRKHPLKRFRPLPAGELSPALARFAAIVLALAALVAGYLLSPILAIILLIYLFSQISYSFWLKHVVLLDVLLVAAGFVLRVGAGVSVIEEQRFSPWLYVCTGLLALFVVLGKRRHELVLLGEEARNHRTNLGDYTVDLIDRLIGIVTTSGLVAYSLYTFLAEGLPENNLMMLTIPFVLYAIFRYLYLIHVRHLGGAPEDIFLRDRPLQVSMTFFGLVVLAALYFL